MLVFSALVNCCPYYLLSGSTLSLPPYPAWISILYKRVQCVRRGGVWDSMPQTEKHLPQSPLLQVNFFRWRHFALPSMRLIFERMGLEIPNRMVRDKLIRDSTIKIDTKILLWMVEIFCKHNSSRLTQHLAGQEWEGDATWEFSVS